MKHFIILFVFLLISVSGATQTLKGIVYDSQSIVRGVKITNLDSGKHSYSNDDGTFTIDAIAGDSLNFSSLFHKTQTIQLKSVDFEDTFVIELKTITNELESVTITNTPTQKEFNPKAYNQTLNHQIQEDIKNNSHKYYPANNTAGVDFIYLAKLIGTLFKKKNKNTTALAKYNDFKVLFENNAYFNSRFLSEELNISEDYKFLFFEFCETQNIKKSLFNKDNAFLLTETLLNVSHKFHEFLENVD